MVYLTGIMLLIALCLFPFRVKAGMEVVPSDLCGKAVVKIFGIRVLHLEFSVRGNRLTYKGTLKGDVDFANTKVSGGKWFTDALTVECVSTEMRIRTLTPQGVYRYAALSILHSVIVSVAKENSHCKIYAAVLPVVGEDSFAAESKISTSVAAVVTALLRRRKK